MNRKLPLAVLIAAMALAAGCDRTPKSSTAYNNSGKDATAAEPAATVSSTPSSAAPSANAATPGENAPASQAATTPDTASSNVAGSAAPADNTGKAAASGAVSETVTTGKIKAAIAADSAMKDSDISVSTDNGVVTLGGTVKSQDQVAIATNLAQRQEGVQRVQSNITVR